MGSSDVDRACGFLVHHGIRDDRSGRGAIRQPDFEAVGRQHLGHRCREMFTTKTLVVADNNGFSLFTVFDQVLCESLRAAAHVVEGVIFGDKASPAVGAEYDFVRHKNSLD